MDKLASLFMNIGDAQALMQRYKDAPEAEEFAKMSKSERKLLKDAAEVKDSFGVGADMMV